MRVGYYGPEHVVTAAADPRAPGGGLQPQRDQAAARGQARHGRAAASASGSRWRLRSRAAGGDPDRGRARAPLRARARRGPRAARQGDQAGRADPARRRQVRGTEPVAARGRGRGGQERDPAPRRARRDRGDPAPVRFGLAIVRAAVPARGVEAVRDAPTCRSSDGRRSRMPSSGCGRPPPRQC